MLSRSKTALLISFLFALMALAPLDALAEYSPIFKPLHDKKGGLWIAIRKLSEGAGTRYLAVDPRNFGSAMLDESETAGEASGAEWQGTPFAKALEKYNAPSSGLQTSGLRHGKDGLFLTIDLCPSHKKMDIELFQATMDMPFWKDKPVPVAIAVSGMWMEKHGDELDFILGLEKKGSLSITWVNHTNTHPYEKDRPLEENFLLSPGVDFEREVLDDEQALIRRGLLPSPFFRFPGLVADRGLLERLKKLSLIPVGADAWIAKGERPKQGSIILVHGNGNEPEGTKKLLEFYGKKKKEMELGELRFLPLKDAIDR